MMLVVVLLFLSRIVDCRHHLRRFNDQSELRHKNRAHYRDPSQYQSYCAPRDEVQARYKGLSCMRKCSTNKDCQNDRKLCLCDGVCGLSCIRPEKECPELPDPQDGQVHLTGRAFQDRAVYTCDEGYQIIGLDKIVCQATGKWSGEQPICRHSNGGTHSPYYCSQPPIIPHATHNGSKEQTFFDLDTELSYHCDPGFKRLGFDHAKCFFMNRTAQWYGPDLSCVPIECGPPEHIMHGKPYGDCTSFRCQVNYRCDRGFLLEGRTTRICQKDGSWTPVELPVCNPVECGIPSSPTNGKALFTAVAYKSVVSYECSYGFMIKGNSTRTCESDKNWSGSMPECVEINCGTPGGGTFPNGWLEGSRTTLGAEITFRCLEGMVIEADSMKTECGADGKWSHPLPKCLAPCIIPEIHNGNASQVPGTKIKHGNTIVVNCTENHEAGGEGGKIECNNGTWSHIPRCDPARCKSLPTPPSNGMIVAPRTKHGATGLYQCKDGYRLKGQNRTRCEFGTWTGSTPICQELYCSFPGYLKNGRILLVGNMGLYDYRPYVKRITNDRQIMFDCNKEYILTYGSPQGATCVGGNWSPDTLPECVPENHPHIRWLDKRSIKKEELQKLFPNAGNLSTGSSLGKTRKVNISRLQSFVNQTHQIKKVRRFLRKKRDLEKHEILHSKSHMRKIRKADDDHDDKEEDDDSNTDDSKVDCPKFDTEGIKMEIIKQEGAKVKVERYNAGGSTLKISCKQGYNLTSVRSKVKCRRGDWKPSPPVCSPLGCQISPDFNIKFSSEKVYLNHGESINFTCSDESNASVKTTCTLGRLNPPVQCSLAACKVPVLENGNYIKGAGVGSTLQNNDLLDYECTPGFSKPLDKPLQCKNGKLVPMHPKCIISSAEVKTQALTSRIKRVEGLTSGSCKYSTEEENLVAFNGDRLVDGEEILQNGESLLFRCSDIGKFKLVGHKTLTCKQGKLSGPVPTCEGLNQLYNYAQDLPPTILFRHENGPIAQSNDGQLLVYPTTTLHMECLYQKKNGVPRWIHQNSTRKTYPQGWAQGYMRDSTLEYRLSIYHAVPEDTGKFTCLTPNNSSHTIEIKVEAINCPPINLTSGLVAASSETKLGTTVKFSCTNGNSLVGADSVRCLPTGQWSQLIPTCDKVLCPDIRSIVKDSVVKISPRDESAGGKVYLACPRGFQIKGITETFCQPDGTWNLKSAPTCKPIRCRNPRLSKNLRIDKTGPYNAGDMAKYHCKTGFKLEGKPISFCNTNGDWSDSSPHCVKACTYPGATIRGTMDTVKFYYKIGDTVNYQCSENTTMKGEPRIKCLKSGQWSNDIPQCLEKT